jgi:hypothetical protein
MSISSGLDAQGVTFVLLVVLAVVFPGLLILLMLGMGRVERRLGRGLLSDQVEWMLRSELPAGEVEIRVAEHVVGHLSGTAANRGR